MASEHLIDEFVDLWARTPSQFRDAFLESEEMTDAAPALLMLMTDEELLELKFLFDAYMARTSASFRKINTTSDERPHYLDAGVFGAVGA